jgi:hypothetical protein
MAGESRAPTPFNSPLEVGLRVLALITAGFPTTFSLQRLVVMDYLLIHSDDVDGGPPGLHPRTPHRGGEILARRGVLQAGLMLFQSRSLVEPVFDPSGLFYRATDGSAAFLDVLDSPYVAALRERAEWVVDRFSDQSDEALTNFVDEGVGRWGAEFTQESVLWTEDIT